MKHYEPRKMHSKLMEKLILKAIDCLVFISFRMRAEKNLPLYFEIQSKKHRNTSLTLSLVFGGLVLTGLTLAQLNLLPTLHTKLHSLPLIDKAAHGGSFFLLGICSLRVLPYHSKPIMLTLMALAAVDEGLQSLMPYRFFDTWDLASNLFGIGFAWLLIFKLSRTRILRFFLSFYFVSQSTLKYLSLKRTLFIEKSFKISSRIYLSYFKPHQKPWCVTSYQLQFFVAGSLGRAIHYFLHKNKFQLQPKAESHDVFHVLTGMGTTVKEELGMQFLLFGNGKKSLYTFLAMGVAMGMMPEKCLFFIQCYQKGKQLSKFYDWDFESLLNTPIVSLQQKINSKKHSNQYKH